MKNLSIIPLLIVALLLLAQVLFANDKYTEIMQTNISAVYRAQTVEEYQASANAFYRIAEAEKTKWEPYYYEAFAYVMMATRVQDGATKDVHLDAASKALEAALLLQPAESELIALEGFVHMMRVTVDPASRGQLYSGKAFQSFNKAIALNPENPRALSLLAQMQLGTAQFFGSPTTDACATVDKALEKFGSYQSTNSLAPVWGKSMTESVKAKCK
jgi:tetratricopeptide (TPR) repeat protein